MAFTSRNIVVSEQEQQKPVQTNTNLPTPNWKFYFL